MLTNDRLIIIEDTTELQCEALNIPQKGGLRSLIKAPCASGMIELLWKGETLGMLKALKTGHPVGITTVYANFANQAHIRIEQLVLETVQTFYKHMIDEAINLIIFILNTDRGREVSEFVSVNFHGDITLNQIMEVD